MGKAARQTIHALRSFTPVMQHRLVSTWGKAARQTIYPWRSFTPVLQKSVEAYFFYFYLAHEPVLRIRDVYPGARVPDPNFIIPDLGSKRQHIQDHDPQQRILSILNPKKCY
jgi:hypothetical protein